MGDIRQLVLPILHSSNVKSVCYHPSIFVVTSAYEYAVLLTETE